MLRTTDVGDIMDGTILGIDHGASHSIMVHGITEVGIMVHIMDIIVHIGTIATTGIMAVADIITDIITDFMMDTTHL